MQANHWRRNTEMPYQIASAQTLAKRGYWPESDVIIIDEAHTQLKVWTEFMSTTRTRIPAANTSTPVTNSARIRARWPRVI